MEGEVTRACPSAALVAGGAGEGVPPLWSSFFKEGVEPFLWKCQKVGWTKPWRIRSAIFKHFVPSG